MTPDTFIAKHGPAWKQFESSQIGHDLFLVIRSQHPLKSIPKGHENLNLRLTGAAPILNEIAGYELLINLLESLGREPKPVPPPQEDTFTDPEIH